MNRSILRFSVVGLTGLLLAVGFTSPVLASNASKVAATQAASHKAIPTCTSAHLAFGPGPIMSMMTGERALDYSIKNTGSTTCQIKGFPGVKVYTSKGKLLPFKYVHSSQYLKTLAPKVVTLKPHGVAYIFIGKYRCDVGVVGMGTKMLVKMPGKGAGSLAVATDQSGGHAAWEYCTGGSKDWGNTIAVSPVTAKPYYS
jgi:hypothetical protein